MRTREGQGRVLLLSASPRQQVTHASVIQRVGNGAERGRTCRRSAHLAARTSRRFRRCVSREPKVWPCSFSVDLSLSYSDAG
jgi:hypothetical protein